MEQPQGEGRGDDDNEGKREREARLAEQVRGSLGGKREGRGCKGLEASFFFFIVFSFLRRVGFAQQKRKVWKRKNKNQEQAGPSSKMVIE